jgi:hypothetical protein
MSKIINEIFLNGYGDIDDVMYHLTHNIKTELRPSLIHGIGVFAIKNIKEGENLFPNWNKISGIYVIPNGLIHKIPPKVVNLLDMYFINEECGYKVIRLFEGMNFIFHNLSFCNSSYPNEEGQNITSKGVAVRDIDEGEEILEWYSENIYLENSK